MDPIERENRMRGLAISRIARELDQASFNISENQTSILKKTFEDIERYHLYLDGETEWLEQCRLVLEDLSNNPENFGKIQRAHTIIVSLFGNYRIKNKV